MKYIITDDMHDEVIDICYDLEEALEKKEQCNRECTVWQPYEFPYIIPSEVVDDLIDSVVEYYGESNKDKISSRDIDCLTTILEKDIRNWAAGMEL